MPICIPESKHFPDETGEVYVAGWGSVADENCTTGKYGPDPYTMCAPKFTYQNKLHTKCTSFSSPTSNDLLCQQLLRSKNLIISPEPVYTQTDILDDKGKLLTTCYDFPMKIKAPYGWCATCQEHAMPGQPGYCGSFPLHNDEEFGVPTTTKGWGYCEEQCSEFFKYNQTLLQEVQLELLTVKECERMGKFLKVMTNIELCAGKQVC